MSLLTGHRREIGGAVVAAVFTFGTLTPPFTLTPFGAAQVAAAAVLGWCGVWVMPSRGQQPPTGPGTGSSG